MDEAKVPFSAVHTWSNPDEANPHSSTHPRKLSLQGRWCNIAVRLPVQEVIRSPSMSRQNRIDRDPSGSGLCSSGVLANPLDFSQTLSQGARLTRTPSHSRELGHLVHERATPRHPIHSRHPTLSSTPHNYLLSNSRFERKLTRPPRQFRTSFTSGKLGIGSTSFQIIGRSLPNLIRKRDHDGVESVFSKTFSNIHTDSLRSAFFRCSNVSNFSSIWPFLAFLPGTNDNKVSTFPGGIDLSRQALLADPRSRVQQPVPSLEMPETVKKYIYIYSTTKKNWIESQLDDETEMVVLDIDPVGMRGQPLSFRIVEMFLNWMTLRFFLSPLDYFSQCCWGARDISDDFIHSFVSLCLPRQNNPTENKGAMRQTVKV